MRSEQEIYDAGFQAGQGQAILMLICVLDQLGKKEVRISPAVAEYVSPADAIRTHTDRETHEFVITRVRGAAGDTPVSGSGTIN